MASAAVLDQLSSKSKSGIRNRALVVFLYRSGLRVSEICNLTPADVNLAGHSVRVRLGKGAKTTTRGFHPNATDALARWIDTRKAMGFRNGPLFCTHQGGPISGQYVRNLLHHLAAAELDAMIARARTDPDTARQVLAMLTAGCRTAASFYRERQFLIGLGIPAQLLPDHGALGRTDLRL